MHDIKKIILASGSPRRKELLTQVGINFDVIPSTVNEEIIINNFLSNINNNTNENSSQTAINLPSQLVMELAHKKATNVFDLYLNSITDSLNKFSDDNHFVVIGSDTVVSYDNQILGKPTSKNNAREVLELLSGKTHSVFTGVSIISSKFISDTFYCCTDVTFFELSTDDIENYLATNEYIDKAGGYGIQGYGARLVKKINGDYNNVVGLPVSLVYNKLNSLKKSKI